MTPALGIGMAESGSYLVQSPKLSILCLTTCVKARKSCLVMMYHQTNSDCNSFSISEDLVEMIVALTLNIAKMRFLYDTLAVDDASLY